MDCSATFLQSDWSAICLAKMEDSMSSAEFREQVQDVLASGVGVNIPLYPGGRSMLMVAICKSYTDIALMLLEAGADVHAKDGSGSTALHCACNWQLEEVVQALIDRGSRVDEPDAYGVTPVTLAGDNIAITMCLLRAGACCHGLSRNRMDKLFQYASHVGHVFVVGALLESGYNVSTLSTEKQTELLHHACGSNVVLVVEALIVAGCSLNCLGSTGDTPLMRAACEGHEEVVKKLILAGANIAMQNESGGTALHYAAICNHIQCGILLAEGGASVRTKNNFSETPLDLAQSDFQEAIKQALSFTTRKALCIIGNAEGGKSTLIASLQAERTGLFGRIWNHLRRVVDQRKRTAGIETVPYCSQKYGHVLFFDFAGQDDYHGPHQMFLESLLSKPGVSMTLLLVIKLTESEEAMLHQFHRWLTPVALRSTTDSPPHVIVIGSFLDKVKSKLEANDKLVRCMEATGNDLEGLPLRFVGNCFLNCRQPQSEGIDQLCSFLQEVPVPEFRATHTRYSLAWVLYQIRSSIKAQAVQMREFTAWIDSNKENLPRTMPAPEEVCQDLSAAGHALYLPKKDDLPNSWLVLDLPNILHNVYGTLFSHSEKIVNEFGLLHCQHLARLFPDLDHLDMEMVQQLLISLEFCIPVDPAVLKVEVSKLTQSKEVSGWLFFPALISAKPPQGRLVHSVRSLCWQLRTSKKHSISAHVLQTILLRLAAHFVAKLHDEEGIQQHCCSVWWNGIAWQSTVGVHVTVQITHSRVIQVIATSKTADQLCQYLTEVVSDILSTVHQLSPRLVAAAYIVHPVKEATSTEKIAPKELFPVEVICNSTREHKGFALSLKDCGDNWNVSITDLFGGYTPSLKSIESILWTCHEPNQQQSPNEENLSQSTKVIQNQSESPTHEVNQLQSLAEPYQSQPPKSNQPQSTPQLNKTIEGDGELTDSRRGSSGAQAHLDISSTPEMRYVDDLVVTSVAANWQKLALRLGVEGCVSEIIFKNYPNDCEGACRDMLDRWLRGDRYTGEEQRTWCTLLTALGRAGFVELERRLRNEFFKE